MNLSQFISEHNPMKTKPTLKIKHKHIGFFN